MKYKVALLGKGGSVGGVYLQLLKNHPLFELVFAPEREEVREVEKAKGCVLVFSALSNDVACRVEPLYAAAGIKVVSSASYARMEVPLIIPEINGGLLKNYRGNLVAKPNCTLQSIALPLYPLHRAFGLKAVAVTYLQALSGGGRECHLDKNILPYIEGEEEKTEREIKKIFETSDLKFSVHSTRVPVPHGHLAMVSASFKTKPSLDEVKKHWEAFAPLIYREEMDRPQPALDSHAGEGMAVTLGRLRTCSLFDIRFSALSHNLVRGAAGGGLLIAQQWMLYAQAPVRI